MPFFVGLCSNATMAILEAAKQKERKAADLKARAALALVRARARRAAALRKLDLAIKGGGGRDEAQEGGVHWECEYLLL